MKKPVLVLMAAGMGSRYGEDSSRSTRWTIRGILSWIFPSMTLCRRGFEKVIFIIKKENEKDFRERIGSRLEGKVRTEYVFQDLHNLPEGFQVPEGRVKRPGGYRTRGAELPCCDRRPLQHAI